MAKSSRKNSGKRKMPKGRPFKKGQSGNPGGRPKKSVSVTSWMRELLAKSPAEVSKQFTAYADALKAGGDAPFAALIGVRVLMALVNEPDARLLREMLDRVEGKVPQRVVSWRDDVIDAIRQGAPYAIVESELGESLAQELFRAAGVEVN